MISLEKPTAISYQGLYDLIMYYADRKEMLPKTLDELYHQTRGFRILVDRSSETPLVIGSAHLDIFSPTLGEIKSLAVHPDYQKQGLGRLLVEDCEKEARLLGLNKLFVLTYKENFFQKLHYQTVEMTELPEKVYQECVKCHFYNNCNEIALIKNL